MRKCGVRSAECGITPFLGNNRYVFRNGRARRSARAANHYLVGNDVRRIRAAKKAAA